jgi:hypothetical protein
MLIRVKNARIAKGDDDDDDKHKTSKRVIREIVQTYG